MGRTPGPAMHVSDGVLPLAVWAPSLVIAGGAVAHASRRFDEKRIPEVAVLTAIFFVAALIHVPVPPTSIHLSLGGLLGIILGWLSLPAVFVALLFQYVFLWHGGITTLGVNTLTMGAGSMASWLIFRALGRLSFPGAPVAAFFASMGGAIASSAVFVGFMALGGQGLLHVALLCLIPVLSLALLEGIVTATTIGFLLKTKPELVRGPARHRPAPGAGRPAGAVAGALALLLLVPRSARAHDLEAAARAAGDHVRVEAFFSDGSPVPGARVTVVESGGTGSAAVAEGETDAAGRFQFRPRREADLHIVISDPLGHRTEMTVPSSKLRGVLAGEHPGTENGQPPLIGSSHGEEAAPLWARAAAGLSAIAVLAAAAYAALRWRRAGAS